MKRTYQLDIERNYSGDIETESMQVEGYSDAVKAAKHLAYRGTHGPLLGNDHTVTQACSTIVILRRPHMGNTGKLYTKSSNKNPSSRERWIETIQRQSTANYNKWLNNK